MSDTSNSLKPSDGDIERRLLERAEAVAGLGTYVLDITTDHWTSSSILDAIFGIDASYPRTTKGWLAIVHPDDRMMMESYFTEDVLLRRTPFDKSYRIIRKSDGAVRAVQGFGELDVDAQGHPVRMLGTIQDVTERFNLEQEREQLASIVENTTDYVAIAQANGTVTYLNDTFKRIIPEHFRTIHEPVVMHVVDFHPPDVGKMIMEQAIPYAVLHGTWQGESKLLDSKGNVFPILQTIVAHVDANNHLRFLSTTCGDVTEQFMLRDRYKLLFRNMMDGFAYCRMLYEDGVPTDFIYIDVNDSFQTLTGLSGAAGKRFTELLPGVRESNPEILQTYARVVETGIPEQFESDSPAFGGRLVVRAYRPEPGFFAAIFVNIADLNAKSKSTS